MDLAIRRLEEAVRRLGEATAGRERRGLRHDDADDVTGTAATDDAIGFNPVPLLRALHEHGAVVAVMGQVAAIMHGSRELTGDLDLLWDGDRRQAPALAAAFAAAGARLEGPEGRPLPCEPAAFGGAQGAVPLGLGQRGLPGPRSRCPRGVVVPAIAGRGGLYARRPDEC